MLLRRSSSGSGRNFSNGINFKLKRADLVQTQGYIGGVFRDAKSKAEYEVYDPSKDVVLGSVASMSEEDTKLAIREAKRAFSVWKNYTPFERAKILQNFDRLLRDNSDDLGKIISMESGKPLKEAIGEVSYSADYIDFYAHECKRQEGFLVPTSTKGRRLMAIKQPVGVCAMITPWNFPLGMMARKVGPCLAAGCTTVVKPAADTPFSALAFAKLGEEAGIPPGVLNIIPCAKDNASAVGDTLTSSVEVKKFSFTGSTAVGKHLMAASADTVKRISLELGGNAPFIVFDDANIDAAVDGLMQAKFRNTGQTCVCSNRIFIHSAIFNEFSEKLVSKVKSLKQGISYETESELGPLINEGAVEKTSSIVKDAIDKGATCLTGGRKNSKLGSCYYEPTVLNNVTNSMKIYTEEIFGPVIPLFKFESEDEVLKLANDTDMGLAGYFYTKDLARAWRVAESLEVGMVGVNAGLISAVQAPFGGIKQSGLGKEGSILGMDEYLQLKYICMAGLD